MIKASAEVTVYDQTDVVGIAQWHFATTSTTVPSKPATTDASATPSGWSRTEPTITSDSDLNKYVYVCVQTVWGDGSCTWGDVFLSASFEAAKRAYNKADSASGAVSALEGLIGTQEAPYVEVEWVESNGTQYVYTDWRPPVDTWGFEADFIIRNAFSTTVGAWREDTNSNGYGSVFGTRNASGVNDMHMGSYSSAGTLRIGTGTSLATGMKTDGASRQTIKLVGTTLTKADGTTATVTRSAETSGKAYANMAVFAMHEGVRRSGTGNLTQPGSVRIYSLKFYESTTMKVHLVGAIRRRDGMTGLYDKVKGHFYPAANMSHGDIVGELGEPDTVAQALAKKSIAISIDNRAVTRMWAATVPTLDRLDDGQQITVTFSSNVGSSTPVVAGLEGWDETATLSYSNVYLRLTLADGTATDWIPCYYAQGTRLTSHYGSATPILLTYRENVLYGATATSAGTTVMRAWYADPNYDTNTTYTKLSDTVKAGLNGMKPYCICMMDEQYRWTSIVNEASNASATGKTCYAGGLRLGSVGYHGSSGNYAAGANTGAVWESYGGIDFRYSVNGVTSAAATTGLMLREPIYLVGTISTDGLFYLDTTKWWTQDSFEEGKAYVYLGTAYSSYYAVFVAADNPAYVWDGTTLVEYAKWIADNAQATADSVEDFVGPARTITGDTSGDDAGEGEVTTFSSLEERLGYERTLWDEAVSDSERRVTAEWQRETDRIGQLITEEYVTNDALVTKTSELADTIDGIQANFTTTVESLATNAQLGEVDEEVTKLTSFVHVTQRMATVDGVDVAYPEMTLGSDDELPDGTPKQPVKARMTNSGLDFEYKGEVVASIHADADGRGVLQVANATATDEIHMGSWLIYARGNGNLSFKYVG